MSLCEKERFQDSETYILKSGPYMVGQLDDENSREEVMEFFYGSAKVLVAGAGGLGCEILKDLAGCGFKDIHVVDMDTVDISNLNRQFLFRDGDIGQPKATVAAAAVTKRVKGCRVTGYYNKLQDFDDVFYSQFHLVVSGLDSIEARRWLNATLQRIYQQSLAESPETPLTIPMIDGGTEGFSGQARVIVPGRTCCFECLTGWFPSSDRQVYPVCTIANTPRLPEHCIEWAMVLLWPKERPDEELDGDNLAHIRYIYNAARDRATQFNIQGVTVALTQGVVKNIVTAIASTNAVIAAACANEAFKIATMSNPSLNSYWQYVGTDGVATTAFQPEVDPECPVCQNKDAAQLQSPASVYGHMTLQDFVDDHVLGSATVYNLKNPSLSLVIESSKKSVPLYVRGALETATRANLARSLTDIGVTNGSTLLITDPAIPFPIFVTVSFA